MKYNYTEIETKWQKYWEENKIFKTPEFEELDKAKPKYYVLDMFPYPSGDGLHVGHPEGYTATDIIARYKRMKGFNVLHPMGWDAFGLPAEQYAVKTGIHPKITTEKSINRFKQQLKAIGFSYDWDREINTTDEKFYKWTQWIFLKLFNSFYDVKTDKARPIDELEIPQGLSEKEKYDFINSERLAYLAEVPVNWSPELGTVLANEEVPEQIEKGFTVIRKPMKQWMLRITKYAERLLKDLDNLNWPNNIKESQKNWIGRSEGALIKFKVKDFADKKFEIEVFTTRPDTIFGATYMVLAPEHPLVKEITTKECESSVKNYIEEASKKSDLERTELTKDKTGAFTGAYAINPLSGKEMPIWISDYVLLSYGTGAIMAVPAHDTRDSEFAKKFNIEIIPVIVSSHFKNISAPSKIEYVDNQSTAVSDDSIDEQSSIKEYNKYLHNVQIGNECFTGEGIAINSDFLTGLTTAEVKIKVIEWLEKNKIGKKSINYKLRDWLFSRQRYWGEPFPIIHFEDGTFKALNENELPLTLPEVSSYKPSGTGESPLANLTDWVYTTDKKTGKKVRRETNTMPNWAGSCWYFLRYIDPNNDQNFCNREKEKYWMPIDLYIGGSEHAVLHLLYARFWYKVLFDLGYVSYSEPFQSLFNQGIILGEDGVKMSKSRGNVINPDDIIKSYGADSMRLFEMFMGPLEATKPWNTKGIEGINRFLNRVWRLVIDENTGEVKSNITSDNPDVNTNKLLHQTIKKITNDIENGEMKFNTSIAQLMILLNEFQKLKNVSKVLIENFILLLSPFAPHICEELWQKLGHTGSVSKHTWPEYDEELAKADKVTIAFSVNGKLRDTFETEIDTSDEILKEHALNSEKIKRHINGKEIIKTIIVKNKMVNIVVK